MEHKRQSKRSPMNADSAVHLHSPNTLPGPMGYSQIAEVNRAKLVYISGQVPRDASGALVGKDDFRTQLMQVFTNLKQAIEAAGGSFADIIKLNYYCIDRIPPEQQPAVREVRDQFVNTASPPA